jgi:hypothetical protein
LCKGCGACLIGLQADGLDAKQPIRSALAAHDRTVLIRREWIRDPIIQLSKDGYYCFTATTLSADVEATLPYGGKSLPGWYVRAWRSRDLVEWETYAQTIGEEKRDAGVKLASLVMGEEKAA